MRKDLTIQSLLAVALAGLTAAPGLSDTLKGGIEEKGTIDTGTSYSAYPAPQFIQQPAHYAPPQQRHLNGGTQQHAPLQQQVQQQPQRPPLQMTITKTLPPSLLGAWNVQGSRTKVEAQNPQFQGMAENAFAMSTANTWTISGNPQSGYSIGSDTGVTFQLWVDKVEGGAAFVRYQHPINNTMAQEAIVMQLENGGTTFTGLERISIIKQGEPGPRCKVQYQLVGHRR
jgi:hypothetical protein